MSSILSTNTFLIEHVAPNLHSVVNMTGMVCRLLHQPESLPSAHSKDSSYEFPVIKKKNKHNIYVTQCVEERF